MPPPAIQTHPRKHGCTGASTCFCTSIPSRTYSIVHTRALFHSRNSHIIYVLSSHTTSANCIRLRRRRAAFVQSWACLASRTGGLIARMHCGQGRPHNVFVTHHSVPHRHRMISLVLHIGSILYAGRCRMAECVYHSKWSVARPVMHIDCSVLVSVMWFV